MEVTAIAEQVAKQPETIPFAVEVMILSALGFCVVFIFKTILIIKDQNSTLHISDARLETKLDTVIEGMAGMRAELSNFKTELDVLKGIVSRSQKK